MARIEDLPYEMLDRIFNNLDTKSIISFSLTCRKYFHYLDNYNEHQLDFQSISKEDFDIICHLIKPSNIISLKLTDNHRTPGQIKFFLQTFPIKELTRLKSLKLTQIDENDFDQFLKDLPRICLSSIEIAYREYLSLLKPSTISNLQEILSLKTMRKVHLDIRSDQRDYFQWPSLTSITHLTLMNIHFDQLLGIIQKFNNFLSIILENFTMKQSDEIPWKFICLEKLQTFQITRSELFLDKIQSLIVLMKELTDLKLEGSIKSLENFFENLLERNLSNLRSLEFYFQYFPPRCIDSQSIIRTFLKQSHWKCFVNADWIENENKINLYSIPPLNSHWKYSTQHQIFPSTISFNRFEYIHHLHINLDHLQTKSNEYRLFPRVKSLKCTINDQCSSDCFQLLKELIDPHQLIEISLLISSRGSYLKSLLDKFLHFLVDCSNVESIEIFNRWHGIFSWIDIYYFCSMISINIKYLSIDILEINQIEILIDQLKHLRSIQLKFSFEKSLFIRDILQLFVQRKINLGYSLFISMDFSIIQ